MKTTEGSRKGNGLETQVFCRSLVKNRPVFCPGMQDSRVETNNLFPEE